MKTNVPIELSDQERFILANTIDRKQSKRLATRAEVVAICQQHVGGMLGQEDCSFEREQEDLTTPPELNPLYTPDPEEIHLMAHPNNPGYVRGWNLVKRDGNRVRI